MAVIEKRTSKSGKLSYRAKIRVKGFPPATATFKRKTDADRWAQRVEAEIHDGRYFPNNKAKMLSVADLIDVYLTDLNLRNPKRYKDVAGLLKWWKMQIGNKMLSDFCAEDVLKGQHALLTRTKLRGSKDGKETRLSNATVNRYLIALNTAVMFGVRRKKWIRYNPVADIEKLEENPGRCRYLSDIEIDHLILACKQSKNPYLLAIVIVGIATGARKGEIARMQWKHFDKELTKIVLPKTKNGQMRVVYLSGIAQKLLIQLNIERDPAEVFLFPSPNDNSRSIDFRHAWENARAAAGLEDFHFHDLRHTCGSYLAMNGANAIEIADVLGHKTLSMVQRYSHLSPKHVSTVVEKMASKVLGHVSI